MVCAFSYCSAVRGSTLTHERFDSPMQMNWTVPSKPIVAIFSFGAHALCMELRNLDAKIESARARVCVSTPL